VISRLHLWSQVDEARLQVRSENLFNIFLIIIEEQCDNADVIEMRWNWMAAFILLCIMAIIVQAVQASEEPAELKGSTVKIQDIVQNPTSYEGKNVVIEGKIDTECPAGCWFIVNDESASLYIDILPSNFVIPQKAGSSLKVYGQVTMKDNEPMMIGKIVEIDGAIYR
jgi:hypothetical protein